MKYILTDKSKSFNIVFPYRVYSRKLSIFGSVVKRNVTALQIKSLETYPGNISEKSEFFSSPNCLSFALLLSLTKTVFGKSFRVTTYGHFNLKHSYLHHSRIWIFSDYIRYIKASFLVKNITPKKPSFVAK